MRTIWWKDGVVVTIDQSKLPNRLIYLRLRSAKDVATAIKKMQVRGAPLIGVAAAYGLALTAWHSSAKTRRRLFNELTKAANILKSTRPTGVNLFWAISRIIEIARQCEGSVNDVKRAVIEEAQKLADTDLMVNKAIGQNGAILLEDGDVILTHCNPGAFGTVGYGTALGVIRAAFQTGKKIKVIVTETRPMLQGARLTTFELARERIPVTLITDGMVGYIMEKRMVNKVLVGADRILKTGHVINKIGTLSIAITANYYHVPFYVAAPLSTFDLKTKLSDITIEERSPLEVTHFLGRRIAYRGVPALNPAFDITPPDLIKLIITENGLLRPDEIEEKVSAWSGDLNI